MDIKKQQVQNNLNGKNFKDNEFTTNLKSYNPLVNADNKIKNPYDPMMKNYYNSFEGLGKNNLIRDKQYQPPTFRKQDQKNILRDSLLKEYETRKRKEQIAINKYNNPFNVRAGNQIEQERQREINKALAYLPQFKETYNLNDNQVSALKNEILAGELSSYIQNRENQKGINQDKLRNNFLDAIGADRTGRRPPPQPPQPTASAGGGDQDEEEQETELQRATSPINSSDATIQRLNAALNKLSKDKADRIRRRLRELTPLQWDNAITRYRNRTSLAEKNIEVLDFITDNLGVGRDISNQEANILRSIIRKFRNKQPDLP